ncbi:tail fiber domain-containing protein [Streptomyces anulatus]|uniref:tail fiber domain-containing protein n=1 Tax=Streptomyces anulatus TaxID=1892 RepID=UPI003B7BBFA1
MLRSVVNLPVNTWRYTSDPPEVRHLGPMAQDWWAAFGLGGDDKTIGIADTNGVALVCIQALHRLLEDSRQEVQALREQVDALTDAARDPR